MHRLGGSAPKRACDGWDGVIARKLEHGRKEVAVELTTSTGHGRQRLLKVVLLDLVTRRQEEGQDLDELGVAAEERADALDDALQGHSACGKLRNWERERERGEKQTIKAKTTGREARSFLISALFCALKSARIFRNSL